MFLFFFTFSLFFSINTLFFNDDIIHKIYEDKGKYDFSYYMPQIIYSVLISKCINSLIKILALSQINIIDIKKEDQKKLSIEKIRETLRKLKIKFIIFFIIAFIILLFFWYYITCFCSIYENTQIHWIADSITSFGISLIYPIIICLIPGIFRILSLRVEKPTLKILYKFSSFLDNYIC